MRRQDWSGVAALGATLVELGRRMKVPELRIAGGRTLVVQAAGYEPATRRVPILPAREPYELEVPLAPASPVP